MRLLAKLEALRSRLAQVAQAEYDAWDPDSDPELGDPEVGGGGICDAVANDMGDVLVSAGIDQMDGGHDGDDHAFLIAYDDRDAFIVDIPPGVYERGGGYSWKKIKGVTIQPEDVVIEPMNRRDLDEHLEMEENPPWVDTLLTENWQELSQAIEPDLLPLTVASGKRVLKRKVAPGAEYGCGHYGCVMATSRPGIVCKVTSDPTEAQFVELAWERLGRTREDNWPDGIVQYHQIIKLSGSRRGRPAWMLWRDEAWNVGKAWRTVSLAKKPLDYDMRSLADGLSRLGQFKFYAHQARDAIEKTPGLTKEAVGLWRNGGVYDVVVENIFDEDRAWEHRVKRDPFAPAPYVNREMKLFPQIPFSVLGLKGARRLAANLQACDVVLQQMTNEPGMHMVGGALETFLEHGMLLADVHRNNIGQPAPDAGIRDWLITDPGHLAVLW